MLLFVPTLLSASSLFAFRIARILAAVESSMQQWCASTKGRLTAENFKGTVSCDAYPASATGDDVWSLRANAPSYTSAVFRAFRNCHRQETNHVYRYHPDIADTCPVACQRRTREHSEEADAQKLDDDVSAMKETEICTTTGSDRTAPLFSKTGCGLKYTTVRCL